MSFKIACVVPIRKGSERVPNKNTRTFVDTNLLEIKLNILTQITLFDVIIVTTDCELTKKIVKDKYPQVMLLNRDNYYASSECSNADFFEYIASQVPVMYDTLVYTPVTSPFITKQTIENVVGFYLQQQLCKYEAVPTNESTLYDSVVTCNIVKQPLWMNDKPLNYSLGEVLKSQDLPDVKCINWGLSVISRTKMIEYKNGYGVNPYLYVINDYESIDIDTLFDFEVAQCLYKLTKRDQPIK